MQMHDYAVFGHNRAQIGRYLGIASVAFAGGTTAFINFIYGLTGLGVAGITIASGAVYTILHWAFNTYFWKWLWQRGWLHVPNLNGVWKVKGQTLGEDGAPKILIDESGQNVFEWDAEIDIEQDWSQIAITLRTKRSDSYSYTATILRKPGKKGGWMLSYSYKNSPKQIERVELQDHKGFCEIEFNKDLTEGTAAYFNSQGRRTHGNMRLERESR
jgi:hypothetical protein